MVEVKTNGLITEAAFCRILRAIQAQVIVEQQFAREMDKYLDGNFVCTFSSGFIHDVITALESCLLFPDDELISWWLWDAPDGGNNKDSAMIGPAKRLDGMWYSVATPELLYEYLTTGQTSQLVYPKG